MAVGTNCQPQDIEQVYRLGTKMRNEKRPRPIMVKMKETQKRNQIYYARSKLKGNPTFERIWMNDDVIQNTRRIREDLRSVSLLCKEQGIDHKLHSDGIIVDGRKYKLEEGDQLPERISMSKAKTLQYGEDIYFQSQHSPLSNMFEAPLQVEGKVFTSAEHAYQYAKVKDTAHAAAEAILNTLCPYEAKSIGDKVKPTAEWSNRSDQVMLHILTSKFVQDNKSNAFLKQTGTAKLHEATRNREWGIGVTLHSRATRDKTWTGADKLGILLAKVRATIINK